MAEDPNSHPPEEPRPDEGVQTLGSLLASARERHGLTVEQMAAELRVESRLMEALEEDRYELLPAPVFVKGYLRHLASRFGLEHEDLIHRYTVQTNAQDAPVTYSEPIPEDNKLLVPLIVGALVLVVGIPAFWFTWVSRDSFTNVVSSDEGAAESPPAQVAPVPESAAPLPDPGVALEPAAQPPAVGLDPAQQPPPETMPETSPAPVDPPTSDPDPDPAPNAEDEQPIETDAADPAPSADQLPVGGVAAPVPQSPQPATVTETVAAEQAAGPLVSVDLSYAQDSWTEVSDGNGNSLYYALGRAGTTASFDGVLPVSFFLGNSSAVQVSINDRPWPVPEPRGNATTIRFVVDEAP